VRLADLDEDVDEVVQRLLVVHRRLAPLGQVPGPLGCLPAPAVLAGQQATGERAPDEDAEPLVDSERDQFELGLARLR
jgi:hypothetical protein